MNWLVDMHELVLKSINIVRHDGIFVSDVSISQGRIDRIEGMIWLPGREEYNCEGLFMFPGLIDTHVHLREPGYTWKEDFLSGSSAAITSGVTIILDMPNNNPPTISKQDLELKRNLAKERMLCNYGFYIGAIKENINELLENNENFAGIKIFLGATTGDLLLDDAEALETIYANGKKIIVVHAEDNEILNKVESQISEVKSEDLNYSKLRPRESAISAVKKIVDLIVKYKRRTHILHVTTKEEIDIIRKTKPKGFITCEVTPHHLFFSENDYERLGSKLKVNPPVRSTEDISALWEGISDGTITTIGTDHAPHTLAEKSRGILDAPAGIPGLDTFLPFLLKSFEQGRISLEKICELASFNPARIFGIKERGEIEEGYHADFSIIDLKKNIVFSKENIVSKCEWSPFEGMAIKAKPEMVFLGGKLAAKAGKLNNPNVLGKETIFSDP